MKFTSHNMNGLVLFVLLGLSCLLFSCEGKVSPPSDATSFTFAPGSTGKIVWSFDDNIQSFSSRVWSFMSSDGGPPVGLAKIDGEGEIQILTTLFEVAIEKPATLVLKNVNLTYNGTYQFVLSPVTGVGQSDVVVFIAVTPIVKVECPSFATVNITDNFTCVCTTRDGNPIPDVTWYKGNKKIGETGKGEQTLRLINVGKDDAGTYRCEAKSHDTAINVTEIELTVNYPPENVKLKLTRNGKSATIECSADAQPPASFKIFFNKTELVRSDKMHTISEVKSRNVGNYTCVAKNILGNKTSDPEYLSREVQVTRTASTTHTSSSRTVTTPAPHPSSQKLTTTKGNEAANSGTEWYIFLVLLVSGIIIGILFSYIVWCSYRRWFRNRNPKRNPEPRTTEVDTTYQELDLSKMNKEDNYQSLRVTAAHNDAANDEESTYTELNKTRDVENNYQSLT